MAARSFIDTFLQPGEEIISTQMEHHSNYLPWKETSPEKQGIDVQDIRHSRHSAAAQSIRRANSPRRYESFKFNPNTVSVDDLMRLGFSEKQAQSIDNYRRKGGRFRRKSDFARSYVVADSFDRHQQG